MAWENEIVFLKKILAGFHMNLWTLKQEELAEIQLDYGLRCSLGIENEEKNDLRLFLDSVKERTLCWMEDSFSCRYIVLLLPGAEKRFLISGPFLAEEFSRDRLSDEADRMGIPHLLFRRLEDYYGSLPVISDISALHNIFTAFASLLWGAEYEILDIHRQREEQPRLTIPSAQEREAERVLMDMQLLERRYAFENELMEIVSRGQQHRAELMVSSFGELSFEERNPDALRNTKNYSIICNTLMRKAAQQGGVHPLYLDEMSSDFARRIEGVRSAEEARKLIPDMIRAYCRMVRKHAAEEYSPLVRKAVLLIESDLSQNLSLSAIAAALSISSGYLSGLFHQETGKTLTDYVNEKRMELGARLLRGSSQQIQTVAQYCGIPDVNYFAKLFKKYYGVTPREYRKSGH